MIMPTVMRHPACCDLVSIPFWFNSRKRVRVRSWHASGFVPARSKRSVDSAAGKPLASLLLQFLAVQEPYNALVGTDAIGLVNSSINLPGAEHYLNMDSAKVLRCCFTLSNHPFPAFPPAVLLSISSISA